MCLAGISGQREITSLYCVNWLGFVTEIECIYCAVQTGSNIRDYFSFWKGYKFTLEHRKTTLTLTHTHTQNTHTCTLIYSHTHNTHIYIHRYTHTTYTHIHTKHTHHGPIFYLRDGKQTNKKRDESNSLFKFQHSVKIRKALNPANSTGNIPVTEVRRRTVSQSMLILWGRNHIKKLINIHTPHDAQDIPRFRCDLTVVTVFKIACHLTQFWAAGTLPKPSHPTASWYKFIWHTHTHIHKYINI